MQQVKYLSAIFCAVLSLSITACAGTAAPETTREYVSDSWITTKVKTALVEDPQVKATQVNVETYKGTVQLSGFVASDAALSQAMRVARGVKGVTGVKNDMRVK